MPLRAARPRPPAARPPSAPLSARSKRGSAPGRRLDRPAHRHRPGGPAPRRHADRPGRGRPLAIACAGCGRTPPRSASARPHVDALKLSPQRERRTGIAHLRYRQRSAASRRSTTACASTSTAAGGSSTSPARRSPACASPRSCRRSAPPPRCARSSATSAWSARCKVTSGPAGARRDDALRAAATSPAWCCSARAGGARLAWHLTYQATSVAYYDAVVDATTGAVLYRQNLTKFAGATTACSRTTRAPRMTRRRRRLRHGQRAATVDFETAGLAAAGRRRPSSTARTRTLLRRQRRQRAERRRGDPAHRRRRLHRSRSRGSTSRRRGATTWTTPASFGTPSEPAWPDAARSTDGGAARGTRPTRRSWQANREQTASQAFYFVNAFHDHLREPADRLHRRHRRLRRRRTATGRPGRVEHRRRRRQPAGDGGPDGDHINNANMSTPPDGKQPADAEVPVRVPTRTRSSRSATSTAATTPAPSGTSTRTGSPTAWSTNDDGSGALSTPHAGAMGEAWSDWYALDLLHRDGLEIDDPRPPRRGRHRRLLGRRASPRPASSRSTARRHATTAPACPGGIATGIGGYTFGDFGKVFGGPEVHSDGEIWMQTLWDLRTRAGRRNARRAGRLRPRRGDRHRGDAAVAARAVVPRHAQRDPRRRPGRQRRGRPRPHLGRCSPAAAWASTPACTTRATARRSRTSTPAGRRRPEGHRHRHGARPTPALPLAGVPVGFGGLTSEGPGVPGRTSSAARPTRTGKYTFEAPAGTYGALIFAPARPGSTASIIDNVTCPAAARRPATSRCGATGRRPRAARWCVKDDTKYDNTGAGFGCGLDQLIDQ